ncbi:two-component system, response regulator YesN [Gracilibacillus ureilyticus]|uniref:Two-component system, response regulator YesN n=1 Tax=Gracilibacillus ureilyticus TaxID=531814 RepID=A0A1H9PS45_9BACI|nr:response regulator [Gracilibacillus ureilyticus]SER50635.1 two-component system, response regulator YesN [Gracilibacillus ureilyticus]
MLKVFLVDDDVFVRKGIQTLIDWESYGFEVCGEADNGEDALELIHQLHPDLVVTDIRMPVLDGLALIERVMDELLQPPSFIVISGYNDFEYAQRALRFGVQDFLLKPVDQEEIHDTLKRTSEKMIQRKEMTEYTKNLSTASLIKKFLSDEMEFAESMSISHPIMHSNQFTFAKIEVNGLDLDYAEIEMSIEGILNEYRGTEMIAFYDEAIGYYCIVVTDKFIDVNKLNLFGFLEGLEKQISKQLSLPVIIYAGDTVTDLMELSHSYHSACELTQYKYIFSDKTPVISNLVEKEQVYYIDIEHSYYDQMMEYMEENNKELIKKQVKIMLEHAVTKHLAKDAVRTIVNRMNHEVLKQIKEANKYDQEIPHFKEMVKSDQYPLTLDQLEQLWYSFLSECSELINELNNNRMKGTIHHIKKYIHKNYDKPITMKSIANEFFINPVYMGQLFKKTYGIYFKDYILNVRINEAKKLLRTTDLRVYEVAQKVGFNNPDYFVTQFEKAVGKTPSQYRKQLMNHIG